MRAILERVEDAARISQAITLAHEILHHFSDGRVSLHAAVKPDRVLDALMPCGVATVRGHLNLSHQDIATRVDAFCSFCVGPQWITQSPVLECSERWIRGRERRETRPDWHINGDDSFCYVLDAEWADAVGSVREIHGLDATMVAAGFYCVNNARWLLYRHHEGYRRKLTLWPKEWPQWPHYAAGLQAYLAQRDHRLDLTK